MAPVVVTSSAQLDEVLDVLVGSLPHPSPRPRSAVVMTMGALHDGHVSLIRAARERVGADGVVVVTVFVNPTQFGAGEDFDRYPRTLEADVARCGEAGADVVFAPSVRDVYGDGDTANAVTVDPGPLGTVLEGAARPGHFRGVLTVVAKLLHLTRPDVAVFGEKDYQQLTLVRRMVADLDFRVDVVGVTTVREPDGLAMSSRNRYLGDAERAAAAAIPRATGAGVEAAAAGAAANGVAAAVRAVLEAEPGLDVDYAVVTGPALEEAPSRGTARILVAVRAGATRLIDNVACELAPGGTR
jgi:pantoate--beta-alanine ligase